MTPKQVIDAVRKYDEILDRHGISIVRVDLHKVGPQQQEILQHARWMCQQIPGLVAEKHLEKVSRWLGFIQGVLWAIGEGSIDDFKDDNR